MNSVTIFCASSPDAPQTFLDAAYETGRLCALSGIATVTGAGSLGLMGEVVRGTLDGGGRAIGVIPRFMVERGWANPHMSELHVTDDMHSRKRLLFDLGQGAIALPGGLGTMDELMDLLTHCQLGLYHGPVVMVNTDGFYDGLLRQFAHAEDSRLMRHLGLPGQLWRVASTPLEAIDMLK